ncbi:Transcriptional regulatory protein ZraR [Pararobbsia alpina]|uniref:sigma-54 dependent transcriptional regulator n=1 Tax=Pararobbsia alpina TaxID=621374 RepID=UPI0039A52632
MDASPRNLIYLTRTLDQTLRDLLADRGWSIRVVGSSREAEREASRNAASAGLLDLSSQFDKHELASLERCLTASKVGWVAAATVDQMADPAIRRLIRDYCFDYVTLPCPDEKIVNALGHAYGMAALTVGPSEAAAAQGPLGEMVGASEAMLRLFRAIRKVSATDAPVYIHGESGTGKELCAQAIHEHSARRRAPFVAINCGAISPQLLLSELFGYERGAFTGANQRKIGRIEAAHTGTLFLDEIGDLPLEAQASLLRFLQEGTIDRLGGFDPIPVDVRVISATHFDLQVLMGEGRFRSDLFHRLCVLRIDNPPLRARGKDIEVLARHVLERYKSDASRTLRGFSDDGVRALYNYEWPGNVRELINRVRRAIVMTDGRLVTAADLELGQSQGTELKTLAEARERAEREAIELALERHPGRLVDAARELGISRVTLYRLMSALGMSTPRDDRDLPEAAEG